DAAALEVVDLARLGLAVLRGEGDRELAGAAGPEISGAILVAEGMAADHDRLRPARHQPWHIAADDRLAKDRAVEDVADRPVGRLPHLLEAELLHPRLVGRDRRAFHADAVL